jgi:AraC-like DNA-binding protein
MKRSCPLPVALPDYGVLFAESVHTSDFCMTERTDPFHKLIYVLDGSTELREPKRVVADSASTGNVLVIPRGVPHTIHDLKPSTLLLLCLSGDYLATDPDLSRVWREIAKAPERRLCLGRPSQLRLQSMWRRAMVESSHARIGDALTIRALAAEILVLLARLSAPSRTDSTATRMAAVFREIDETFYDDWNLDRAATRAGLSRRRFSALFRATTQKTFWNYLNERRLDHAARRLRSGEHSVIGVMFACGFNDVSHFYRLFRRRYGNPPQTWARGQSAGRTAKSLRGEGRG